jgi:hypothetical protein
MQLNKHSDLMVTVAALLVPVAMGYLQFYYESDGRAQRAGMQGINLLYLPGGMHWNQLDSPARHKSILAMLKRGPANAAFMDTAAS